MRPRLYIDWRKTWRLMLPDGEVSHLGVPAGNFTEAFEMALFIIKEIACSQSRMKA